MKFSLKDEIEGLYESWLIETHPEDIKNKDDLVDKVGCGFLWDDFVKELKEVEL